MLTKTIAAMAVAVATLGVVTGCSSHQQDTAVRSADDPDLLAGCGPLPDQVIATTLQVPSVHQQSAPTICNWIGDYPAGGTVGLTYAWLRNDNLMTETKVAGDFGYQIERVVIKHFAGMYVRDPNDPGSCAVTISDTGIVTWWVHNRSHTAQPDPCAAAMSLMQATLAIDGV
ncbi:DUF3558 domain-containing protein [Nocardia sp. NPDC006630]|uniref:DUF3558 domain-containing protein n=1 Tax=Nocardia sp. NPDC006630 TaxID=3157181 RepID=UPI0033B8A281